MITYNKLKKKFPGITMQEALGKAGKKYMPCPVCGNKDPKKTAAYVIKKTGINLLDSPLTIKCGTCGADLSFEKGETKSPLTGKKATEILAPVSPEHIYPRSA